MATGVAAVIAGSENNESAHGVMAINNGESYQ